MKLYDAAGITRAFGGVENGDAKHMLAANVTAIRNGNGLTPTAVALLMAIGATSTAVAVLLMNMVRTAVVRYMPPIRAMGPASPSHATSVWLTSSVAPVFSRAKDMGIMAAISTTLSQFMVR